MNKEELKAALLELLSTDEQFSEEVATIVLKNAWLNFATGLSEPGGWQCLRVSIGVNEKEILTDWVYLEQINGNG